MIFATNRNTDTTSRHKTHERLHVLETKFVKCEDLKIIKFGMMGKNFHKVLMEGHAGMEF